MKITSSSFRLFLVSIALGALTAACATVKPAATAKASAPAAPVAAKSAAPAAATPAPMAPKGKLEKAFGVVTSADARRITIKDKRGVSRSFTVASDAKLTKGGDQAKIGENDIRLGDHVSVRYGGDVAASIHVSVLAGSPVGKIAKKP